MATACFATTMEQFSEVIGIKVFSMEKVTRPGQMDQNTSVNITTARKKVVAFTSGKTVPSTQASGSITRSTASASMNGKTVECTLASGKMATCTASENTSGKIVNSMKVNMSMIRNTGMGFTLGRMGVFTRDTGKTGNNMVLLNLTLNHK